MKKKLLAGLLCALMLLTLCACGAKSVPQSNATEAAYDEGDFAYEKAMYSMATADMAYEENGFAPAAAAMSAARAAGADTGAESADAPEENPEKIIYSSDVTVETTDFDAALGQVSELVDRFGGWVESSSINGANYYDVSRGRSTTRSASYTLRIPSARFEELMGSLTDLGNVPYTHVYTENVTAQYYDVQARLTAYETQEARLLEMMEKAESVEDIITIEERLSELRYQIESLQSTLRNWDRRVSYSSVYLQLNEVKEYTPDTPVRISFGERLSRAFRGGLSGLGDFFEGALLWLVEALPTLIVLAVLAVVLIAVGRSVRRKRKAKRASSVSKTE